MTQDTSEQDSYGIQFTIPDGTPDQQIEMIKSLKKTMQTFADVVGEKLDPTPFDEAIANIKGES